jgi:hypothetical protein
MSVDRQHIYSTTQFWSVARSKLKFAQIFEDLMTLCLYWGAKLGAQFRILQANFNLLGCLLHSKAGSACQGSSSLQQCLPMTGESLLLNSRIFWFEPTKRFPSLKLADFSIKFCPPYERYCFFVSRSWGQLTYSMCEVYSRYKGHTLFLNFDPINRYYRKSIDRFLGTVTHQRL